MSDDIIIEDKEILQEFITESIEHLESTEPLLIELEEQPENTDLLNAVFRSVHSIKGSAGFLGLNKIQQLSHKMEGVLDDLRKGKKKVNPDIMDIIFETSDTLKELINNLKGENVTDGFLNEESEDRFNKLLEKIDALSSSSAEKTKKPKGEQKKAKPKEEKAQVTKAEEQQPASLESLRESKEMLDIFIIESEEHLENIEKDLLEIDKHPDKTEPIDDLFRAFHSIKGSAACINLFAVSEFAHCIENLLNIFRTQKLRITKGVLDLLFESVDALKLLIETHKASDEISPELLEVTKRISEKIALAIKDLKTSGHEEKAGVPEKEQEEEDHIVDVFTNSAFQYVESCNFCLKNVKDNKHSPENTNTFLRSIESLKKSADFMGFEEIAKVAELIFDTLTFVKSGKLQFEKEIIALLDEKIVDLEKKLKLLKEKDKAHETKSDKLGDILVENGTISEEDLNNALKKQRRLGQILVEEGIATEDDLKTALEKQKKIAASGKIAKKVEEIKTVRVDQHKIDKFMNLVGELIITRNSLFYFIGNLNSDSSFIETLKEIKYAVSVIHRISDDLQTNVMKMRMLPIKTVFQRFPRMVRDIARSNKKKVELRIIGEDTEIDKTVAELLGDPLVHLIRNAVDHGIEMPAERANLGKSENGTIILKASQEGNMIIIEIIDDGAGMDPAAIKKKALEKGIISIEEAMDMTEKEQLNLIFKAGLSTAKEVTDISGRGVGMDVVKTNIAKLKGRIDINSDIGQGSKIRIELPLTLAIIKVLLIESKKEVFAMPLDSVVETVKILPDEIIKLRGKDVIFLRGEILGITKLSYLLGLEKRNGDSLSSLSQQLEVKNVGELLEVVKEKERDHERIIVREENKIPIVVLDVLDKKIGIVVDALQQQQEIVIKPMESYLAHIPGLGGATIMGDGRVVLILDPIELVNSATHI